MVIVNNAAMNIGVLMFFQISVLSSFGYIPRSGIYATEYYLAVKKKKILLLATIWMDPENIMLSEISQLVRERQIPYDFTHMWNLNIYLN